MMPLSPPSSLAATLAVTLWPRTISKTVESGSVTVSVDAVSAAVVIEGAWFVWFAPPVRATLSTYHPTLDVLALVAIRQRARRL